MPKKPSKKKKGSVKYHKVFVYLITCFITVICLCLTAINLTRFLDRQKVLGVSASNPDIIYSPSLEEEKKFWRAIVEKNPSYRDGYLELSHIEYKLGNKSKALEYFQYAKKLDPNSQQVKSFESVYLK